MYLDLNTPPSTAEPVAAGNNNHLSVAVQGIMYFASFLGVILSAPVLAFASGGDPVLSLSLVGIVINAALALLIMPVAASAIKNDGPLIIQIALYFQYGVFWRLAFGVAEKAISPPADPAASLIVLLVS